MYHLWFVIYNEKRLLSQSQVTAVTFATFSESYHSIWRDSAMIKGHPNCAKLLELNPVKPTPYTHNHDLTTLGYDTVFCFDTDDMSLYHFYPLQRIRVTPMLV